MSSIKDNRPSDEAVVLSAGFLATAACFCGVAAFQDQGGSALLCSPLFLGAVAGAYSYQRPIRAALVAVALATLVLILAIGPSIVWFLYALFIVIIWAVPAAILGAICGATVRRRTRRVTP
jgi:hypothetical protein